MCGGDVEAAAWSTSSGCSISSARHFMELLATEKTQARIEHMLKTGKPLRN
jgi:3-hydroxyacyl-CoA dehydrogenase